MPSLHEKYQPKSFAEIVGQAKAIERVQRIIDRPDFDGDSFLVVGDAGQGKTSLAWIMARRFASDFHIAEIDGEKCSVEVVREIDREMNLTTFDGGFRVYIVNEIHSCTPRAVQAWLTTLERRPKRVMFIFTTTVGIDLRKDAETLFGEFCSPFVSRCKVVRFTNQGWAQCAAERCREIAQREGLDGRPIADYVRGINECRGNMRMFLQRIDMGDMLPD